MESIPRSCEFKIERNGPVSAALLGLGITHFSSACRYLKDLPYQRNSHKEHVQVVLDEQRGTCSTKHGLLKALAEENGCDKVQLRLGIYRLHGGNAAAVGPILDAAALQFLPEAHWFLRMNGTIYDFTFPDFEIPDLEQELLLEVDVRPDQIGSAKDQIHRDFLMNWLLADSKVHLSLDELWLVREKCILALSST